MTALITKHFGIHNAMQFAESFSETDPNIYYLFIGKSFAFTDELNPPTPIDNYEQVYYDFWRDIIALKRIQASDISHCVPIHTWTTGTVYTEFDHLSATLPTDQFYVVTSQDHIFKCIDNNRGAVSTVMPTGTGTSIITTADNYRWKYMYTLSAGDKLKFMTTSYMPVKTLTSNNGSSQWQVQDNAANGAIHHIKITANGSGYITTSNSFAAITNSSVVRLNTNALNVDDAYNQSTVFITSGLGSTQLRKIINYIGVSRTATLNSAFTITPNTSSTYIVGPNVTIRGDSGSTISTRATAYVANVSAGQIKKIKMISTGYNYSQANVTITSNSSYGSGATARVVISPLGGHGKDPVDELYGKYIMTSVFLSGNTAVEGNTIPSNNDFRTIGIIRDPLLRNGAAANTTNIDQTHRVEVVYASGDFTADEVITGATSKAKGKLVYFANNTSSRTDGTLKLIRVTTNGTGGGFVPGEEVRGGTSNSTAIVDMHVKPACREFTGLVIYTENRLPVTRSPDQIENIKFVLGF